MAFSKKEIAAFYGRFVILDLKLPENWPTWLVKIGVALTRPFGVTLDIADRHPWESLRNTLRPFFLRPYMAVLPIFRLVKKRKHIRKK